MGFTLLFLVFSLLALCALVGINFFNKKAHFRSLISLFLFGVLMSVPFIMVEFLAGHLKFYLIIMVFIAIELAILYFEKRVSYFHSLIHHNIRELRIVSFFVIGLGFTYSEISFTILAGHNTFAELLSLLPLKTIYSLLMHTVFTSAASLVRIGNLLAETIYETLFKLASYYLRISLISVSHFLYTFSSTHDLLLLTLAGLGAGIVAFFQIKRLLDRRLMAAEKIERTA